MKKIVKVVMLPTENKAHYGDIILDIHNDNKFFIKHQNSTEVAQHLYLISDDEIKEGDWVYDKVEKHVFCYIKELYWGMLKYVKLHCRKIVATTDKSLTKYSEIDGKEIDGFNGDIPLPQISQPFIEAYIKANGEIDEVEVEMEQCGVPEQETYQLKLQDDNTVVIHQAYTYTHGEILALCFAAFMRTDINKGLPFDYTDDGFDKWAENNI